LFVVLDAGLKLGDLGLQLGVFQFFIEFLLKSWKRIGGRS